MRTSKIPLYLWIKDKGSINNIKPESYLSYYPTGWDVALEVLKRYYDLYKIKINKMNRYDKVVVTAAYRYGSKPQFLESNFDRLLMGQYDTRR